MNYTLMHKDIPVVEIALDDGGTKITRVAELYHGGICRWGFPSPGTKLTGLPSTHGGRTGSSLPSAQG